MEPFLTIGEVAARTGESRDTIRYYERVGLVPAPIRTAAGYRQYRAGIVNRLALIRNAQRFGFSLREIRGFLGVRDGGGKPATTCGPRGASHRGGRPRNRRTDRDAQADESHARDLGRDAGGHTRQPPGVSARLPQRFAGEAAGLASSSTAALKPAASRAAGPVPQ